MKKLQLTTLAFILSFISSYGINYTSTGGNWNTATTWIPNGIPNSTSNITVISGNVTIPSSYTANANNVTINSGATLTNNNLNSSNNSLTVGGILTNNGTYAGNGRTKFSNSGNVIAGNGNYSNTGDFYFYASNETITGMMIKAGGNLYLSYTSSTPVSVINQGHIYLMNGSIRGGTTGSGTWTNDVGSYVGFAAYGFISTPITVNASALNDTVEYDGSSSYQVIQTSGNTYYTLLINGGGVKPVAANNIVVTNLNILSGGILGLYSRSMKIAGNVINNGTFAINSDDTLTFSGNSTISGTGSYSFGNLVISSGSSLNINNENLSIRGNWTNNGTVTGNTGTITFNGSTAQKIIGTGTSPFAKLTLSNSHGLTIAGTSTLTGTLNITSGNLNAGSSLLTLISNATSTARIASVPSASALFGSFIIQRYITGTKTDYQCLSTPIKNMTLGVWDVDPGFYMSGIGGVHGNAGSYKSVYTINEPTDAYVAVTTTSYVLTPAQGLYLYFGNGSPGGPMSSFAFASSGTPNYGSISDNITYTNSPGGIGFNLIGNPYPSPILWSTFHSDNSSNITSSFQIYDEKTGSWVSSNGVTVTNGSSKLAANPNVITMCQGFECTPSSVGTKTITFKETEKTATDIPIVSQPTPNPTDWVRMQISNNVNTFSDGAVLQFVPNTSSDFNVNEDVQFRKSFESTAPELFTLSTDNQHLTINQMPENSDELDVPLVAKGGLSATYTISFEGIDNLQKYDCVTLEDITDNKTVSLENSNSYSFQVSDTSKIINFVLHFKHLSGNENCTPISNTVITDNNVAVLSTQNGVFTNFNMSQPTPAIISVYNVLGQKVVADETVDAYQNNIKLNIVPSNNIYIVVIHTNNQVITKKIYY